MQARNPIRWTIFALTLAVAITQATPATAGGREVLVDFVYPVHPEEDPEVRAATLADGKVLPYATIQFTFVGAVSPSSQGLFEAGLRVHLGAPDGPPLAHLHEVVEDVPVRGPHASFHWHHEGGDNVLWYHPFGLGPGNTYHLTLPAGWQTVGGLTTFETAAATGTLRTYDLVIPDVEDWREISTVAFSQSIRKVPCVVFDRYNPDVSRPVRYDGANVKLRGRSSRSNTQKNLTLSFHKQSRFEGFVDENGFQGARRKVVLVGDGSRHGQAIFRNKISYDIARSVETRQLGAS